MIKRIEKQRFKITWSTGAMETIEVSDLAAAARVVLHLMKRHFYSFKALELLEPIVEIPVDSPDGRV